MRKVDLGWMRVFTEVARQGSLSAAAKSLNLTQPAVSYQIRRAEAELGAPLLHRLPRGIAVTDAGAQLYDILSHPVARIDALAQHLRDHQAQRVLRLFTDYAFSGLWLMPRLHAFRDRCPQAEVQIVAAQRTDLTRLGPDDTAVVFGARADFDASAVLLQAETVVPVCAPGQRPADLATARLIHLDSAQPAHWLDWPRYLAAAGMAADTGRGGAIRLNTYSLVIDAAVAGQGTALGWRGLIEAHLHRGSLIEAGPEITIPERGYFALGHAARSPAAMQLQDWLQAEWRKPPA